MKLSTAKDVTNSAGLAVPTSELNAATSGTISNILSTLKSKSVKFNEWISNSSFSEMGNGYVFHFLNKIESNISDYETGIGTGFWKNGPMYTYVLGKFNNDYYAGILFSYMQDDLYFFQKTSYNSIREYHLIQILFKS